ncbi:hypothetical protein ACWEPN_36445 [Nonomuraea wenchangensis]
MADTNSVIALNKTGRSGCTLDESADITEGGQRCQIRQRHTQKLTQDPRELTHHRQQRSRRTEHRRDPLTQREQPRLHRRIRERLRQHLSHERQPRPERRQGRPERDRDGGYVRRDQRQRTRERREDRHQHAADLGERLEDRDEHLLALRAVDERVHLGEELPDHAARAGPTGPHRREDASDDSDQVPGDLAELLEHRDGALHSGERLAAGGGLRQELTEPGAAAVIPGASPAEKLAPTTDRSRNPASTGWIASSVAATAERLGAEEVQGAAERVGEVVAEPEPGPESPTFTAATALHLEHRNYS